MNASAFRPSTIEALKALWVALPVRASNDGESGDPRERQMQILDTYCFALSEFSSDAIMNTVNNLRAGRIDEASKSFCPKAPELAVFVRNEQRRLDAINRPKMISLMPQAQPWKDWRIAHLVDVFRERRRWIEFVSKEKCETQSRQKKYPAGSTFKWSLGPMPRTTEEFRTIKPYPGIDQGSAYGPENSASNESEIWGENSKVLPQDVIERFMQERGQ